MNMNIPTKPTDVNLTPSLMIEILPCRADQKGQGLQGLPEFPGEIREENDVEKQARATGNEAEICTVRNDLPVAAEVKLGQGSGWQTIYPEGKVDFSVNSIDVDLQLSVRLRDDAHVRGKCRAEQGSRLWMSQSFGNFGDRATRHFQRETAAARQESQLRKLRQKELDKKLGFEVTQVILRRQKWVVISISFCMLIPLGTMVFCAVVAFNLETELQVLAVALALLGLFGCAGCGLAGLNAAAGRTPSELEGSVQAARPELERYEDDTWRFGDNVWGSDSESDGWKDYLLRSCLTCGPLFFFFSIMAVTITSYQNGYGWPLVVLWCLVALINCAGGIFGWREGEDRAWRERAGYALAGTLFIFFSWPIVLLEKCGLDGHFTALLLKPPKKLLDTAVHNTHEHTIVFEGNVLPNRETVCSWPGKYATAWDELVAGSRQNDISAAVVFLPEGSEHYGFHDPIPPKHDLQDLHGECWCTPLYGERKPWGCRWWSKWIANVDEAASQKCTLVVYYFNGMTGEGKVKDFTTAGSEHMRREAIFGCKDVFLESESFQTALEAGLKRLSKDKGPDSSSPYSREVHRLFLAWLPEEDRRFLEASEGLGNSQKAEVAWLERKGYQYVEKEVRELASSSPKVRRATQ